MKKFTNFLILLIFYFFCHLSCILRSFSKKSTNKFHHSYSLQIRFDSLQNLYGNENPDSVTVLTCYTGSQCGSRATASNIVALWEKDTIRIFELCGMKRYERGIIYKFVPSNIKLGDLNKFSWSVGNDAPSLSLNYKIYFGSLQ